MSGCWSCTTRTSRRCAEQVADLPREQADEIIVALLLTVATYRAALRLNEEER